MAAALEVTDALAEWVGRQRWFVGKDAKPSLRRVASIDLHEDPLVRVSIAIVEDRTEAPTVVYQVPVVLRRVPVDAQNSGFIGTVSDDAGDTWHVYDGPRDPAFTRRLAEVIADGESCGAGAASLRGIPVSPWPAGMTSTVLGGEQSNTSIVYSPGGDDPYRTSVICKLFRMLHDGENPDVVLQSALFGAGSKSVPELFGSVVGEWPDETRAGDTGEPGRATGHLAFAQRFLTGAVDAWGLALAAGATLSDFTASARQIGIATADVHATLAAALPTREAGESDIRDIVAAWRARRDAAIVEVPELAPLRESIEILYERASRVPWPRLQRIHGDLHLGQVLAGAGDTWAIIDFEGEPLRPLADRCLPDLPLRDIAGMLRSFDYAAGAQASSAGVAEWAHACRAAFVDGYIDRSERDVRRNRVLLDAFELDKALYEVVYEARNRPSWLPIPTMAVHRITDRVDVSQGR
ncbi:putative trehalose synthase [Cryobacterium mesophilum]|uniref:Maltokinase n=1 Tax=Terrimesophilobacter mesophilus TaxID=433647 RepID=A0A4R8VB14_9MICO|nr:phosphotransferase [Terrimesophilobacter mesophilus]MBB5633420.1 putative trehalose synthase [Terrimesophilobacter mesophilus]TFB80139.1 phosphotransferase [Terrimesophilobacter mesophilus]